ncbi:acylneuraminate cytidylyltransferase family protein [Haloquadratum walsbyi]|uniref:Acylneuraminate cytidylyltransferase n=1 Tax=Haloquadratum walsbyi (strain DSM 16790 / HBSQ001) TaxID=362976 RepID=Q18EL4_HALWD|nr:acylneuraminate cytidylyltransferase family protein [Haloquadratum walsbyi]CAJ53609.1 acylneuraminate cytidylyltransferase [Haloquadratum walsbyi DSM 16790]
MSDTKILGVIPARSGSTRVENKNIREVGGEPLIAHAINHADESELIDVAVVSTDDNEIREVARKYGGFAPFKRPEELATEDASINPVVSHALNWFKNKGKEFDIVCLIHATTPLRKPKDIDECLKMLINEGAKSVVSVSEFINPPQWSVEKGENGYLSEYFDLGVLWGDLLRTQELNKHIYSNTAVLAAKTQAWEESQTFYTNETISYEMPEIRSFDIDEPWELTLVRALYNHLNNKQA